MSEHCALLNPPWQLLGDQRRRRACASRCRLPGSSARWTARAPARRSRSCAPVRSPRRSRFTARSRAGGDAVLRAVRSPPAGTIGVALHVSVARLGVALLLRSGMAPPSRACWWRCGTPAFGSVTTIPASSTENGRLLAPVVAAVARKRLKDQLDRDEGVRYTRTHQPQYSRS